MTTPDLLGPSDFNKFKTKDENWFLGAAGETIRDYCHWHIYPSITETIEAPVGQGGIIMLPSLNVTAVSSVTWDGEVLDPNTYEVNSAGFITLGGYCHTGGTGFVTTGPNGAGLRRRSRYVTVTMTHGFATLPKAVAEVGFELTGKTLEKPSGVAKKLRAGPYDIEFNEFGAGLSETQERRLDPYVVVEL